MGWIFSYFVVGVIIAELIERSAMAKHYTRKHRAWTYVIIVVGWMITLPIAIVITIKQKLS